MKDLRFTLLTDGSSDAALLPVLKWVVSQYASGIPINGVWADTRGVTLPDRSLARRITFAVEYYPCDLLFVHRDAEIATREKRVSEIQDALNQTRQRDGLAMPVVCVIPVRMQEAWLLFDEVAIRRAAGNPNGKHALSLPAIARLESLPDPKVVLHSLLRSASGLNGKRLKSFRVGESAVRVTTYIGDFSPLRRLPAFVAMESETGQAIQRLGVSA